MIQRKATNLRIDGQPKFDFHGFRERNKRHKLGGERSRIGSRSSWGEGDRDQSTLYGRTNKNEEEKVVRNEQEMYPGEKPLMGPEGNTGNCLPLTHKGLHSHSLLV